jgi:outer membrane lipoprotein LolB
MKPNIRLIVLVLSILLLGACQHTQKKNTDATINMDRWQHTNSWSISGKMSISDGHNNGSGRINWHQTNTMTTAKFRAPLGQGSWSIEETISKAILTSSKHGVTYASTAEELISNELGWYFPWNNLKFWLRGLQTNMPSNHILPDSFNDNGWHIEFQSWMQTPIGMLPKKIKANKGSLRIKLIIYSWDIQ